MELDLENIIRQEILDNFHHKYLVSKEYVNVEISDSSIIADITINNVDFSSGISLVSGSRFTLSQAGAYNLEFSAQFDKTNSSNSTAYIWLRKNGADVADTNTSITLGGGANDRAVAAWNFYVSASANDYYELMWSTDNAQIQMDYQAAGVHPAIPSVILTVNQVA